MFIKARNNRLINMDKVTMIMIEQIEKSDPVCITAIVDVNEPHAIRLWKFASDEYDIAVNVYNRLVDWIDDARILKASNQVLYLSAFVNCEKWEREEKTDETRRE